MLATPPELLTTASPQEQARLNAMLDSILPVSARAKGLVHDTAVGKHLAPAQLESIHAPTLIISARDDRYGTFASAQYTASRIAGAKFIGFDQGGHTWIGHDDEVMAEILKVLICGALDVRTPVPGLLLAGQDVSGPGIQAACLSGLLAAAAIEPKLLRRLGG